MIRTYSSEQEGAKKSFFHKAYQDRCRGIFRCSSKQWQDRAQMTTVGHGCEREKHQNYAQRSSQTPNKFSAMGKRVREGFAQQFQQTQTAPTQQQSDQQRRHHGAVEDAGEWEMEAG